MEKFQPASYSSLKSLLHQSHQTYLRESRDQSLESFNYDAGRPFYIDSFLDRLHYIITITGGIVLPNLPSLNKKDCDWWINERKQAIKDREMRILDLGCGNGTSAHDVQIHHPEAEVYGITAYKYEPQRLKDDRVKVGNAYYINQYYPPDFFDIVYSYKTLINMKRPLMNIIPHVYKTLAPGGCAFIESEGNSYQIFGREDLEKWLENNGHEFYFYVFWGEVRAESAPKTLSGCAFRKRFNDEGKGLVLPISYDHKGNVFFDSEKAALLAKR